MLGKAQARGLTEVAVEDYNLTGGREVARPQASDQEVGAHALHSALLPCVATDCDEERGCATKRGREHFLGGGKNRVPSSECGSEHVLPFLPRSDVAAVSPRWSIGPGDLPDTSSSSSSWGGLIQQGIRGQALQRAA
jgi:hypothetical protein